MHQNLKEAKKKLGGRKVYQLIATLLPSLANKVNNDLTSTYKLALKKSFGDKKTPEDYEQWGDPKFVAMFGSGENWKMREKEKDVIVSRVFYILSILENPTDKEENIFALFIEYFFLTAAFEKILKERGKYDIAIA